MPVKSKVKISQNFVAFSEYMNFNKTKSYIFLPRLTRMQRLSNIALQVDILRLKFCVLSEI